MSPYAHLLHDAALGGADELEQFVHFGAGRHLGAIRSMACVVFSCARVSRRKAVCSASIDGLVEAAPLQADAVGAEDADFAAC